MKQRITQSEIKAVVWQYSENDKIAASGSIKNASKDINKINMWIVLKEKILIKKLITQKIII